MPVLFFLKREENMSKVKNTVNWVLGICLCCLGVCLCTKADFGLSMIAAPPYIIHCFFRDTFSWYTQGTSEYLWQTLLVIITCIAVRKIRLKYFLSFLTAILSGFVIDGWFLLLGGNGVYASMPMRIAAFAGGSLIISLAVAFVFRTTLPPQAYELIVSEIADKFKLDKSKTKLVNDILMLAVAVILSRALTHSWTGIGIGTVIATFANAPLIKLFGKLIDKIEKN